MPTPEIDALRARWESRRSPALTLQLAERYRDAGARDEALEILAGGLEQHPEHVAARVAKGRCHLELNQAQEAVRELEKVAFDDPAHLLANKLLVEAHARLGNLGRARDRLDLYALLGGDGREIEELEQHLSPAADASSPTEGVEAEPFALPPTRQVEMDPSAPKLPSRVRRPSRAVVSTGSEPFALGDWLELDDSSYRAALFGDGLFSAAAASSPSPSRSAGGAQAPGSLPGATRDVVATLTLAELYRKQGHGDEAAGIFREILERQPGNVEAARALHELEREKRWPLSAEDLLGDAAEGPGDGGESPAGRVLRRYRDRLRRGE